MLNEAHQFIKSQYQTVQAEKAILQLLRKKALTVGQSMDIADAILDQKGIPVPLAIALIRVESTFDVNAVSNKGAKGLTQVMPLILKTYTNHPDLKNNANDPTTNVKAGLSYLTDLHKEFGDWTKALRGYVAGPKNANNSRYDKYAKNVLKTASIISEELKVNENILRD